MNQTQKKENELPYQEANFEGIEKHILKAKGIPSNSEIGRRPFMDLLATVGGGLSLSSLLAGCGSKEESTDADSSPKRR